MAKKKKKHHPTEETTTPERLNQQAFADLKTRFQSVSKGDDAPAPPPRHQKKVKKIEPLRRKDLPKHSEKPEIEDEKLFSWWMRGTTPLEETSQGRSRKKNRDRSIVENEERMRKHAMMAGVTDEEHDRAFIDVMHADDNPSLFAEAVDPLEPGERLARAVRREEERLFAEAIEKLDENDLTRHARHDEPTEQETDDGAIEDRLDLHGNTVESAMRFLDEWLWSRHLKGLRWVLVVTGKGNKSRQGGILRDKTHQYLNENPRRIVRAFHRARGSEGGSGAWIVELKPR